MNICGSCVGRQSQVVLNCTIKGGIPWTVNNDIAVDIGIGDDRSTCLIYSPSKIGVGNQSTTGNREVSWLCGTNVESQIPTSEVEFAAGDIIVGNITCSAYVQIAIKSTIINQSAR